MKKKKIIRTGISWSFDQSYWYVYVECGYSRIGMWLNILAIAR